MKSNRIIWSFVFVVVLVTIIVSYALPIKSITHTLGEPGPTPPPDVKGIRDFSHYPVVSYDQALPENTAERESRRLANKRYDGLEFVMRNPTPLADGAGWHDHLPLPPLIPTEQSGVVVMGEITSASAYLSNDKFGIYSEFGLRIDEVLKADRAFETMARKSTITIDRIGGYVVYPNGQKVRYNKGEFDLPKVGHSYLIFLTRNDESPNYQILSLYEFKDGLVRTVDGGRDFSELKVRTKTPFVEMVRAKLLEGSPKERR